MGTLAEPVIEVIFEKKIKGETEKKKKDKARKEKLRVAGQSDKQECT